MAEPDLADLFRQLDSEYLRLRALLARRDASTLAARPSEGRWSIFENLQHLVFTGLGHLARFVPEQRDWAVYGLVEVQPRSEKQLRLAAGGTSEELLAAWTAAHEVLVRRLLDRDSPAVRHHITRHIRHQQQHIDEIQRLSRRMGS